MKLANLKVKDQVELPAPPRYLKWYISIKEKYILSEWINITSLMILLLSLIMTISRYKNILVSHKISGFISTLFFISLFFTLHSFWTINSIFQGVIFHPKVEVLSEPNSFSTKLFEVHDGLKVNVENKNKDCIKIELIDGKTGWIKNNQIKLIN